MIANFCGHCGKKMTAKDKKAAREAGLPFCSKCLPTCVRPLVDAMRQPRGLR